MIYTHIIYFRIIEKIIEINNYGYVEKIELNLLYKKAKISSDFYCWLYKQRPDFIF